MARKSKAKRMKKSVPVHRFMYYRLKHSPDDDDNDSHYIDIGRDLSRMNRRLYRQGMTYHIANITMHDTDGNCRFIFSTIPNTWPTHAAWKACFKAWKKQRAQVLDTTGSTVSTGRWSDFKVYFNYNHISDPDVNVGATHGGVGPCDDDGNAILAGVWDYADLSFSKDSTRYDNHAVGMLGEHQIGSSISSPKSPDDTAYDGYVSLLEAYQEIAKIPEDDNQDSELDSAVLLGMNLTASGALDDVIDQIIDEGDDRPYNVDFVGSDDNPSYDPGGYPTREAHIASTYSPTAQVGGFAVPLGLLKVKTQSATDDNIVGLIIELAPGSYKGVSAIPMGM